MSPPARSGPTPEAPTGPSVLAESVAFSPASLRLVSRGVASLWRRIVVDDSAADARPLLLSYDVHPTPDGPVLIEVNTNAGGVLSAFEVARRVNHCDPDREQDRLRERLLELFRRDLIGEGTAHAGRPFGAPPCTVAIVDDDLASQPLLGEMQALATLLRSHADVLVVDASELAYHDGRLRHRGTAIDRVYWRSTDFVLSDSAHGAVRRAVAEGTTAIAPSPAAYGAIAHKRRFVAWSHAPELARDEETGLTFRIAGTRCMSSRSTEDWYGDRKAWVFKPESGHAGRGVYVGKRISRQKLAALPPHDYLAQCYVPHPVVDRAGTPWKYDVRFYADRGEIIGAAARVFQGQVVGMTAPGSGFAALRVDGACCLSEALLEARRPER